MLDVLEIKEADGARKTFDQWIQKEPTQKMNFLSKLKEAMIKKHGDILNG